ncbi:unnamed protein product [Arabis nemorensis]|uniref:DUF7865 domain-containing protein n=1 Tax=Arabis nemorensis TaxID=586526 RepID=A0A565AVU5_9BRAS|nr:unnamed protein product [Arabis nemorensis]
MMSYTEKASIFGHGSEIANKLKGSTPHDELLIQISQSFSVILYVRMALWSVMFEWKIEDLSFESPRQALGDIALAVSWSRPTSLHCWCSSLIGDYCSGGCSPMPPSSFGFEASTSAWVKDWLEAGLVFVTSKLCVTTY